MDMWYYAQSGKSVGPVSLSDLRTVFSGILTAENILVWRTGFPEWVRAGDVAQLATFFKEQSSALLPPVIPIAERASHNSASSGKMRTIAGSVASVAAMVVAAASMRALSHPATTAPRPTPNPATLISGETRNSFVSGAIETCMKRQEDDPDTKAMSLTKDRLSKYCSCYANKLADATTFGELTKFVNLTDAGKQEIMMTTFKGRIDAAGDACITEFRKSLLGGR
jgi:hypothetical protein